MYSFSIRQFIWEYIVVFFVGGKVPLLMYSFSIRQFIWEYIGVFFEGGTPWGSECSLKMMIKHCKYRCFMHLDGLKP